MVRALNEPFVVLESERLVLRPWLASDAGELYELARDPAVGPSAGWPVHASVENSAEIIEGVLSADGTFAVVLKETGELIGCAGFNFGAAATMPLNDDEGELGYWLGRRFWGHGSPPRQRGTWSSTASASAGCAAFGQRTSRKTHAPATCCESWGSRTEEPCPPSTTMPMLTASHTARSASPASCTCPHRRARTPNDKGAGRR